MERTSEQMMVLGARAMNGAAFFVKKLGSRWVVEVNGHRVPKVFRRKREALAHADVAVSAFWNRQA